MRSVSQTTLNASREGVVGVAELEARTHRILLLGDEISCLSAMSESPDVDVADELQTPEHAYSAAVIGIALPDHPGELTVKQNLNLQIDESMTLVRKFASLKHIILVIGTADGMTSRSAVAKDNLWGTCDSVSQAIQAEVEQRVGAYVIVTIILAGLCDNPALLAERVIDRATQTGVTDAATVVTWEEITGDTIGDVGLNQFL